MVYSQVANLPYWDAVHEECPWRKFAHVPRRLWDLGAPGIEKPKPKPKNEDIQLHKLEAALEASGR